jgi:hypothetical protein
MFSATMSSMFWKRFFTFMYYFSSSFVFYDFPIRIIFSVNAHFPMIPYPGFSMKLVSSCKFLNRLSAVLFF